VTGCGPGGVARAFSGLRAPVWLAGALMLLAGADPLAAQPDPPPPPAADSQVAGPAETRLAGYVGWYGTSALPVEIGIALVEGGLVATVTGQQPLRLLPDSPHRFRVAGLPDTFLDFHWEGERAVLVRLEQRTLTLELRRAP